eukprot:CAMPEP_0203959766 /NCGR_PEP_ID=MMETSP0359-20131031/90712_1 /ASSEMBLY_ACC=CAM_ASM_000338 /TAXON_ID=268821 /ORGANISM="Scrippsiella Hangoei, Strain SHTV-5" /LENGTH=132 /DNA_ID=CAMNT_0050893939 /DNA_START=69 /DNA_END=463 /DNA_ORIENTATION=+
MHLQTNEQTSNWPRGLLEELKPWRAASSSHAAARKLLVAFLAFCVTSFGSPAAFLFEPLVFESAGAEEEETKEADEAGLAHRSLREPASASPAAGKILTKSLSKMLTLMAFPIWRPSWKSDTTTLKPSAGVR